MTFSSKSPSRDNAIMMPASLGETLLREFNHLGGREILERILGEPDPRKVVEALPAGDFFWLVKKIGDDDCLPVLELATPDQWQYLLDLEIWDRDEINPAEALAWLRRLFEANRPRTVEWLLDEGSALLYRVFQTGLEVLVREEDNKEFEIPEGFFTHDGVLYLQSRDAEAEPFLRVLTGAIAAASQAAYQTLISGLASTVPSEMEEGMYRMRTVRLAEYGFLPFEEALSIYSPLSPDQLKRGGRPDTVDVSAAGEPEALVPFLPLHEAGNAGALRGALSRITDPLVLDRIRLEFAGLANQVASVQGLSRMELDSLVGMARRAAGYINIALEEMTGKDRDGARELLEKNPLEAIFRVGFGFVLRLKRVAENWLKIAWFRKAGFENGFWGDERSLLISGLLLKKPLLYTGLEEGEAYRDFAGGEDLSAAGMALMKLIALDGFMDALTKKTAIDRESAGRDDLTCFHLLLTFWARMHLGLEPGFEAIRPDEARSLFASLREGETTPPYRMARFEDVFVEEMLAFAEGLPGDLRATLREELASIWDEFRSEYEEVPPADTDMKHNPFLLIR
ncbi:MAG: DUF6178 family protein [Pseudomonadota bacterium]|jgi:hypothetical protein|nr:hypothetical protein [Syntrophobacterales bacterium]MDI9555538.1 DUF6178 family protein [Pseudomonadota bacterium]NLX32045.1 hypothetical protein [Deltaproteobacteria bacterium]HNU85015.1 DUF6178 family protein [Syntrophales bacterium]HNZ34940.1 DUF6178 family protein [Syntrophales bacterium]